MRPKSKSARRRRPGKRAQARGAARLLQEAKAVAPLVRGGLAQRFVHAFGALPPVRTRTIYRAVDSDAYYTPTQRRAMPAPERRTLRAERVDPDTYFNGRFGSRLAYVRPLELLGLDHLERGARFLDLGYGGIGHLIALRRMGMRVTGIDKNPALRALYADAPMAIELRHEAFASEGLASGMRGDPYDVVIAKNVLKRGYVHPRRPVPDAHRVDLGVDDEAFIEMLFRLMRPGARMIIYNIGPMPSAQRGYVAAADIRSAFPRGAWSRAGFRILHFDADDTTALRAVGAALDWETTRSNNPAGAIRASSTLVERPMRSQQSTTRS